MSYVFRKIKKYSINLLEVFAYNQYYNYISIIVLVLTWTSLFGVVARYINSFIILSWVVGWWYATYKLSKENELLRDVIASLSDYNVEDVREDLAALMHNIWAEDVLETDLSVDKEARAGLNYLDLSNDDKQVNLTKADRVLELIRNKKRKYNE
jgi:hypothetical protein